MRRIPVAAVLGVVALLLPACMSGIGPSGLSENEQDLGRWLTLDPRLPFELAAGASRHVTVDAGGSVRRVTLTWNASVLDVPGIDCDPANTCSVEPGRPHSGWMSATVVHNSARRIRARVVGLRPGSTWLSVTGYSRGPCEGLAGPYECGPSGTEYFNITVVP